MIGTIDSIGRQTPNHNTVITYIHTHTDRHTDKFNNKQQITELIL